MPISAARKLFAHAPCHLRQGRFLPIVLPVMLLMTLIIGGCSRVQIAYNTADFAIELYASRYLALDDRQVAVWRPILAEALDRHRDEALPVISALLAQAAEDVDAGLTDANVTAWMDRIEPLYQRHARLFATAAAPLLVTLSPEQIDALEKKFQEQAREDATDNSPASLAKRQRKRTERYIENIEWVTGELTHAQRELVSKEVAKLPDTTSSWYAYRDREREALIARLKRGADSEQIRVFLTRWLADFQDMPVDLVQAREQIRSGLIRLMVALDGTFSEEQRQHFKQRLRLLSEDFQSLQRRQPTEAPGV
ncbi:MULTISPECIES: DUF6279 family lipoprotein [Thiorhodovibrio]|uniref:DUF6279 family lipoprotein n=1 Tax=Thiorhodovibrio TaxID=61593 RepID=UPI00191356E6|nr:DUF6279 family lipoprotein [Thiorhodovibrio litoralis]